MHPHQQIFCLEVKKKFCYVEGETPFNYAIVLDVGSLDINGSNRFLFEHCIYTGIDVVPGPNVDIVMPVHKWHGEYDTIICTETLEHDMHWADTLRWMYSKLKIGGLLIITCATVNRPEHGTKRLVPESSGTSQLKGVWSDYYRNLTELDFREALNFDAGFSEYEFQVARDGKDLYFWGIRKEVDAIS